MGDIGTILFGIGRSEEKGYAKLVPAVLVSSGHYLELNLKRNSRWPYPREAVKLCLALSVINRSEGLYIPTNSEIVNEGNRTRLIDKMEMVKRGDKNYPAAVVYELRVAQGFPAVEYKARQPNLFEAFLARIKGKLPHYESVAKA